MTLPEAVFLVLGAVCVIVGLVGLLVYRRGGGLEPVRLPVFGEVSAPAAVTIALVLVLLGYHTAAYGGPAGLLSFCVPQRLWWLVYGGGVLAVVGALLADRLDRDA